MQLKCSLRQSDMSGVVVFGRFSKTYFSSVACWLAMILLLVFTSTSICAAESSSFLRHFRRGVHLLHQYRTEQNISVIACCAKCNLDSTCLAVSYKKETQLCELNEKGTCQVNYKSVDDNTWEVYMTLMQTESNTVNIAANYADASQSSEHSNYRPAELAVDGNFHTISVTDSTAEAWWSLRICKYGVIARVKVWNRRDCCGDQLSPFDVTVDDQFCGHVSTTIALGAVAEITCEEPLLGSLLKIQRTVKGHLNIAEVQVFSS